uniref:PB1 domain-containing protein n=1 Tax=Ciona savignyi TaxID=51511 RepID=H2YT48_CIOSA
MSVQYKAFLYADDPSRAKEIRRFAIDVDVSSSYEYLRRKVASVFPNLGEQNFALQWRDTEGDLIWLNSDEELLQALGEKNEAVFRLYIKESATSQTSNERPDFHQFQGQFQGCPAWGAGKRHGRHPRCPPWAPPFFQAPGFYAAGQFGHCGGASQQKPTQKDEKKSSSAGDNEEPNTSQSQTQNNGDEYLRNVGKFVSDFLHPFGIDVDVDVKTNETSGDKSTSQDTSAEAKATGSDKKSSDSSGSEDMEWTFVKKDNKSPKKDDSTAEEKPAEDDENGRLQNALDKLLAMGFNNEGGWLANLLQSCNYDISRALDKMQPARGSKD